MSNTEKFSITKLFDLSPVGWYKILGLAIKLIIGIIIVFGILGVINKFFPRQPDNVTNPAINVASGGTSNYTVIQQSEKEKKWWIPSPFVELFGQKTSDRGFDLGMRTGARFDF